GRRGGREPRLCRQLEDAGVTAAAAIDLAEKFAGITEHWRPKVAATLNGQDVRLVKLEGAFPWHSHPEADEMFLVWKGRLRLEFRDRTVELDAGQMCVVPRGIEHRPVAETEAEVLLFEPSEVIN